MKMMVYHGTEAENWARSKKLRNQSEFAYVYV